MYNQSHNSLTYNQNIQATQYSEYPSTCEFSSTYIQNLPNYIAPVGNTSSEHESEKMPARLSKRKRVTYTTAQIKKLEEEFKKNMYIDKVRSTIVAKATNLSQRQVNVWFQNKRQKVKKTMAKTMFQGANNSYNLTDSTTATNPILQSQHHTNSNEHYNNNLYFHSNQPADQNINNNFITNSIPFNDYRFNTYDYNNKFVGPMKTQYTYQFNPSSI